MSKPYGFVYLTTNLENGRKYIGKHKRSQRVEDPDDSMYFGSGKLIKNAVEKAQRELGEYWTTRFVREILADCHSQEELDLMEEHFIRLHNAVESDEFYNLVYDGNPPTRYGEENNLYGRSVVEGKKLVHRGNENRFIDPTELEVYLQEGWLPGLADDSKAMMRVKAKERLQDPTNHPFYGRHHSEESKDRIRQSKSGTCIGENNPFYGRTHSDEYKEAKSNLYKGRIWIKNIELNHCTFVTVEDFESNYQDKGYVKGRISWKRV